MAAHAPLALVGKVGRREEVVAACAVAVSLGIHVGMAATHARALVSDLDFRLAEPKADAGLLDRLALLAVRRWSPIAAATPNDGLWLDLADAITSTAEKSAAADACAPFASVPDLRRALQLSTRPGAAHALARYGREDLTIVPAGGTVRAISPLPIAALRLTGTARPSGSASRPSSTFCR